MRASSTGKNNEIDITSLLRKLLIDLEAGKVVRVALDLQTLIQNLEQDKQRESSEH